MDTMSLIQTFAQFGPFGACCIALVEKLLPVVPSYVVFVALGMMMAITGPGDFAVVVAATASGSTLGALGWYGLGFALGPQRSEAMVQRFGRYVFLKPDLYRRMASAYRRNHFWVTAISQTIPTVRVYISIPAGVLNLAIMRFLAATMVGSLAWSGSFLALEACPVYARRATANDVVVRCSRQGPVAQRASPCATRRVATARAFTGPGAICHPGSATLRG